MNQVMASFLLFSIMEETVNVCVHYSLRYIGYLSLCACFIPEIFKIRLASSCLHDERYNACVIC